MRPSLLLLGVGLPTVLALCLSSGCVSERGLPVVAARPGAIVGDHYDYNGLVHLHTSCSGDATGTVEEVASLAGSIGMSFLISTEHNNLDALAAGKEGWYG